METLNVTDVTRIATEAARELSPRLQVVGVTFGAGDGDYAEILIDIEGCQRRALSSIGGRVPERD